MWGVHVWHADALTGPAPAIRKVQVGRHAVHVSKAGSLCGQTTSVCVSITTGLAFMQIVNLQVRCVSAHDSIVVHLRFSVQSSLQAVLMN